MTGEIGKLALCLALALSLVQACVGFAGAASNDSRWMAVARSSALGAFTFIALAFFSLMYAYVVSDFSLQAVADNSHTLKPLLYKITGVWGNHEGSMLLWLLILGIYSAAIAFTQAGGAKENERMTANALGVQALIAIAFLLFVLLTSDPFARIYPPPVEGQGLNPLLQDPGLAFHPPLLYLGYVGLSAAFSFAVAALLEGRNDAAWASAARPFALFAWTALTLGIALGSWWAYYELGWGGFWFWDPVENASLMPWLVGTALVHSIMATERTGAFKSWTLLLAITAFAFSLIGTFLVRSGVLNSVHAFANDPRRGVFILIIIAAAIGLPLALFAWRAPKLPHGAPFQTVSRETAILLNNLLLTSAAATVFIGTLYPLALDALEGVKISVGPPYFAFTFTPIMVALAILVPFGPLLTWRRGDAAAAFHVLRLAMLAAIAAAIAAAAMSSPSSALGMLAVGLGVWLIAGSIVTLKRRAERWGRIFKLPAAVWTSALAHAGLGVVALGVAGATVWKSEAIAVLSPGDTMKVAGYTLRLDDVKTVQGSNYTADRATIAVLDGQNEIAVLQPERRAYPVELQRTTESAIRTNLLRDLYVVLADSRDDGRWVVRAYENPLAPFIWLGAVVMAIGGMMGLWSRRRRAESVASAVAVPAE